jgi:hypothetical protein
MADNVEIVENVDIVRLLISDVDPDTPLLTEAQIIQLLTLEGGNVKLAAAQALDAIASSEALVSKAIKTQDLSTDGPKTAEALRKHAAALRTQAADQAAADDEGFFDVVDIAGDPTSPELTGY